MGHHHHHYDQHHEMSGKNLFYSVLLNCAITIAEIIGGLMSGSLALLSDALHNFSDVISLLISYIANRISKKEADFSKTFGYKRAEIIAAFVNAATLIILAVFLIIESIKRFFGAREILNADMVIILSIVAIIGNGICVLMLQKGSAHNMNIRSSYLHLLTDMYTSVAVLIGGILMKYYQIYWVDSLLTLLIGGYLVYLGFDLLKSSFKVMMLFSPQNIKLEKLVAKINTVEGVKNIHHIHIWMLNEYEVHLEAHVDLEKDIKLSEFDLILEKIEELAATNFGINHFNIQPEFNKADNKAIIVQD